uniref:Uncharacterized protein n=1 Tax=Rhizophagus irregularis (strain DAOM 181602 / DAOM 197198 / MUCL 43194) TaxID=747089 RepID=U9TIQ3_RHIID
MVFWFQVIQQPSKVPLENAVFKDSIYKEEKEIYLPKRGISFIKQLAYKDKKPYKRHEEDDLEFRTRKAEILMKRRVRGLANNKSKWRILDNGDVLLTPLFRLSYHVFKIKEAILKKVYIKSSDLAHLYSEINIK